MSTASAIDAAAERSELVRAALDMAREAHAGQVRNASGGRPYIDHPVAVAEQLVRPTSPTTMLAAALLHDVVEDSELGLEDVRERCGERVAELVGALTDDESIEPYAERKREHRGRVEAAGGEAMAIYAADKLTNVDDAARRLRGAGRAGRRGAHASRSTRRSTSGKQDLEMLSANAAESPAVRGLAVRASRTSSTLLRRIVGQQPLLLRRPRRCSGSAAQKTTNIVSARAPVTAVATGAEEHVGDQHDRPGHRQGEEGEAGDRQLVGEEDEVVLLLHAEGHPVVGGGGDQQHRRGRP